jgi:hypothetical protein
MENGEPYQYAFLDFAFDDKVEIPYLDTYQNTIKWQGDIDYNNMMIIAAIFNNESHRNYADPPIGRPFDAYYVDASAGVTPGETESNINNDEFSHTIFCEIGSTTTCENCPNMANVMDAIFESEKYPFYFIEMVTDKNDKAKTRMEEYNQKGYPTGFYDGGYEVVVGGGYNQSYHENIIGQSGFRDVHNLEFILSAEIIDNEETSISISIKNIEEFPNAAPETPSINGPSEGKLGQNLEYQISTIDADGDDIFYQIDWGDDTISDWLGPFESGEIINENHIWRKQGSFIIKVKAKDIDGAESDWAWFRVILPKPKALSLFYGWLHTVFPFLSSTII